MRLSCFGKSFTLQNLRHIPSIHKHIGDRASVDILPVRDNADGALLQQLFEPLSCCLSARLAQFRRVDAPESDALGANANCIAVNGVDWLAGWDSFSGHAPEHGGARMFLIRRDLVSAFR